MMRDVETTPSSSLILPISFQSPRAPESGHEESETKRNSRAREKRVEAGSEGKIGVAEGIKAAAERIYTRVGWYTCVRGKDLAAE